MLKITSPSKENIVITENTTEVMLNTCMGKIKGLQQTGHQDFLGLRYAQAPAGELRFQPPQRIDSWEGIYDATHFGAIAPQAYPDTPPIELEESEDCLLLNIYTPAADDKLRPVMVFIHGGGFLIDSGSRPRTYGGLLSEAGDVVVVTIEYRMGALGFLYLDGIEPDLGLQDQVCALEWIRRHIRDFGGDPANVTIFGESAGATSVAYLLVMPLAKGLLHKVILESGAFPFESLADNRRFAETGTRKFFKELKIPHGDIPTLQKMPLAEIMRAEKKVAGRPLFSDRAFYPVIDGTVIPIELYGSLQGGCSKDIPVIIGVNAEELPVFGLMLKPGPIQMLVKHNIVSKLKKLGVSGKQINTLLTLYRGNLSAEERAMRREYNHLLSDEFFRIPATLFAEAQQAGGGKIYFYCFSHPAPKTGVAMHVMELYFVFGTFKTTDIADIMQVPGTDDEVNLSQVMMKAWTSFARNGNPNHSALVEWPPYEPEQRATIFFDLQPRVVNLPLDAIRCAWMQIVDTSIFR
jgi:para-nitrobenzyl esterase